MDPLQDPAVQGALAAQEERLEAARLAMEQAQRLLNLHLWGADAAVVHRVVRTLTEALAALDRS